MSEPGRFGGAGHWLPPGAWQQCIGEPEFTPGEPIWVGVDVGGDRSASAVVWINQMHHVGVEIYHGHEGVLDCVDKVRELAADYQVRELVFDPWRFGQAAQELERERVVVTAFPQTDVRMMPASDRLYRAVVERKLVLPDNAEMREHMANTIARHSRRGWRLDKPSLDTPNDSIIALCMALEALEQQPEPAQLLGWL
jgi:phage terminase large subunit-like protein